MDISTLLQTLDLRQIDFQVAGLRVWRTNYFLVGRNYVRKYTMQWLYRHWWYCLGDTDLC